MKTILKIMLIVLIMPLNQLYAQNENLRIPLIGESAPSFEATSTHGQLNFPDDYFGKWKILFSHPANFTPVCTSEIIELANSQKDFKKLNTQVIVISVDGINSHLQWVQSIESLVYNGKQCNKIEFPLISDGDLNVSKKYGMLHPYSNTTKDVRGVFIIDPEDKIRALLYYPSSTGRNIEEIKRTLIALQLYERKNVFTPANWKVGNDVLIPSPKSIEEANKLKEKNSPNLNEIAWYMWLKKQ
jgi:peroxiredoxin (alkyl hydroperoxide reductase subunit C)